MAWRNDRETVQASRVQHQVTRAEHEIWLTSTLANEECFLLIAEHKNEAIGTVRFDPRSELRDYEVSITLAPEARGKGLAASILERSQDWLISQVSVSTLYAFVQNHNASSLALFRKSGYRSVPDAASHGQWLMKSY